MFYIEITNGLITGKGEGDFKTDEQIEVSKKIYDALTNLPAEYTEADGEIISVEPLPVPEPELTPAEKRQQAYESMLIIEWEGENITVDQANIIFLRYFAERNPKTEEIQTLIIAAKESIRQMYPNEEEQQQNE